MKTSLGACRDAAIVLVVVSLLAGCAGTGVNEEAKGSRVALTGLAQIGRPYVYGAEAPSEGFDCSGLTYYAHHQAGLSIPRTARAQKRVAKPVRKSRLRAGDLVFFKTGPSAYHVGIMVDEERFVHASTSRKAVRMSKLDSAYWQAHFLGAGTFVR